MGRRARGTPAAATGLSLSAETPEPGWPDAFAAELNPTLQGLTEFLSFSPSDGRIWLDNQRMVLLHAGAFGAIRREIIQALGLAAGEAALRRIGHVQGERDAALIRQRWRNQHPRTQRAAGPWLHTLEGFAKVRTLQYEYDPDDGAFRAEFLWSDSVEADEHLAAFGVSDHPCCWTLCGYATGFSSVMQGRQIQFREVECRCTGAPRCRVIARPVEEWDDAEAVPDTGFPATLAAPPVSAQRPGLPAMIGRSPAFLAARRLLEQVAPTDATVLLRGESGVGKELFARTLHGLSARCDRPFIAVNCAAMPDELVEAELFGVERGAFTGATASRPGRFERADGGTLFLDEISLMGPAAQGKLLRALQEREVERVGGTRKLRVDVRVIAASNVDLWPEVQDNRFRPDLFYRLNVFPIDLPPLRSRRDDVPALLDHFVGVYATLHNKRVGGFTRAATRVLYSYAYPGNVRELQNLVERGVICVRDGGLIDSADIFRPGEETAGHALALGVDGRLERQHRTVVDEAPDNAVPMALHSPASLDDIERNLCQAALQKCNGNVSAAARRLGMTRPALAYRLRRWGIRPEAKAAM